MKPSAWVREHVFARDGDRCVSCGVTLALTFQHRQTQGMGGTSVIPTVADGLTMCRWCNERCEADLQTVALLRGWKVLHWVPDAVAVPVCYTGPGQGWFLLDTAGGREARTPGQAEELMFGMYGERFLSWRKALA